MRDFQKGMACEVGNHIKGAIFGQRVRSADWAEQERKWDSMPVDERGVVLIYASCPLCGAKA